MGASEIIPQEILVGNILFIRGKKVMLDKDLATLYEVVMSSIFLKII
jgi:hypothetical protein